MFHFKQFSLDDSECGMPISTDAVMLGAWAEISDFGNILDIGCGCGILSLMLAQRKSNIKIIALDIDIAAVKQTRININNCLWKDRIKSENADITKWYLLQKKQSFSAIICNPPYFISGIKSHNTSRALARHTDLNFFKDIILALKYLLTDKGVASFILPVVEADIFISLCIEKDLFLKNKCLIQSSAKKKTNRVMFSITKSFISNCNSSDLVIYENGSYSKDFKDLTGSFYLKL